jgi:Cd2+/Zn2+-exporting ATPase
VVEGESSLDTSNITGESVPRSIGVGNQIISGVINNQGLLKVKVEKEFGESTVTKILDLVENASSRKAPTEQFISKFARYYTPAVVFIALGIGILPTLFFNGELTDWAYRAFVFLVISCPCALVISIPLGFFGGIGAASKEGILVKGGNFLEALNYVDRVVFDKTGTLTKGVFKVTKVKAYDGYSEDEVLELAAYGESYSNHPIALSILDEYGRDIRKEYIVDYREIPGKGISVNIDEADILLGNKGLLIDNNIDFVEEESIGTVVYVAREGRHVGTIIVSDEIKASVRDDLSSLKDLGVQETIMLSGDNGSTARKVGDLIGIDKVHGDLLPQDKVLKLEEILSESSGKKVAFVGDGVNDAPVLARADVGIAMGGLGSDAAIEAADIVILTDEISKIATGIKIAKKTKRIVSQNIVIALGIKLMVLGLGAAGLASMWQAVFADVGVSLIAILNSIRVLKVEY